MTPEYIRRNFIVLALALAGLFLLQFLLPDYYVMTATRMMVLAVFAVGYNMLLGYVGLLSLGHAIFFAAGLYGAGLAAVHLGLAVPFAFLVGVVGAFILAFLIGWVALPTIRVSFMIVTLMFSQVGFLTTLYFAKYTGGQDGLPLPSSARRFAIGDWTVDLASETVRYNIAFGLLLLALAVSFAVLTSRKGQIFAAIRENEGRTEMLGFNVFAAKLEAFLYSGTIAGAAGAAYGLLFGYIGSTFASIQYSIEVLLFTLLGGAGTLLGPLIGVVLMMTMIDRLSELTTAYLLVIGIVLIALVLWFPKGILGTIRERWLPWLM
ncbi:branched-chain amino acid ABC transporter permease [Rhizobium sp. KVB221]|uniref:Branched-chain amino acid ABC transporter permease n=1 Tax=Rhizobium setariae TaxID=2801340 RepID=A0A936YNG0_9HYPH|nr:branched-chain amino acid ABC transporter permease [Rhizobium setariae]MBL0373690.1 branched-chain amino acid ABC transporter permease [Rhizobium setariae]